jgi:2-polyprenyl-6-methoxyphenol hydroxylase-like FAD-dependent oxidoreductase
MPEAVVVGAGIGGVAAAVALQQCGWHVTVLERAPELGEVGAGLSIWPSAAVVLRQLGVTGIEPGRLPAGVTGGLRTDSGRWLVKGAVLGDQIPVMIHRARLHDRITDQFGPGITVRTGFTVTGVDQDHSGATVIGTGEQVRADLVVGADGLHSAVRGALHPQYPGPQYAGYTSYRGLVDLDTTDGGGETWGLGRRFGFARLEDGRIYWYATANQPVGQVGNLTTARVMFSSWHEPIPQILAAAIGLLQTDIHDLTLPLVRFVTGRVVLLGDAAHAMTPNLGRGACAAIEDAGALARHLRATSDLRSALSAYDLERRPATTRLVRRSRRLGQVGQVDNRVLRGARDNLAVAGGKLLSLRHR